MTTSMNEFSLIYVTFPSRKIALEIARKCVQARVVACVNVFDKVRSIYEWEGKLCEESECVAVLKTHNATVKAAIEKIKSLHPYECPCIVTLPVLDGNQDFLKWMRCGN